MRLEGPINQFNLNFLTTKYDYKRDSYVLLEQDIFLTSYHSFLTRKGKRIKVGHPYSFKI